MTLTAAFFSLSLHVSAEEHRKDIARFTEQADSPPRPAADILWERRPSPADVMSAMPKAAWSLRVTGRAAIRCRVGDAGVMQGCRVLRAEPANLGFAEAAMRLAVFYKLAEVDSAGQPTLNRSVDIPMTFWPPLREAPVRTEEWANPLLRPVWLRQPEAQDLRDHIPQEARRAGVAGRAVVRCHLFPGPDLDDCVVASETPERLGFGWAALDLLPYFKLAAETDIGPAHSRVVTFPIEFPPPDPSLVARPRTDQEDQPLGDGACLSPKLLPPGSRAIIGELSDGRFVQKGPPAPQAWVSLPVGRIEHSDIVRGIQAPPVVQFITGPAHETKVSFWRAAWPGRDEITPAWVEVSVLEHPRMMVAQGDPITVSGDDGEVLTGRRESS